MEVKVKGADVFLTLICFIPSTGSGQAFIFFLLDFRLKKLLKRPQAEY